MRESFDKLRIDCVVCKHSIIGIDTWYCKLHDKYYRERNTKNGKITVAMHTCEGFERNVNDCDGCYHLKPAKNESGVLECRLNQNTPVKVFDGKKCYSFLPKEEKCEGKE